MLTDLLKPFTFQAPQQDLAIKYNKAGEDNSTAIIIGLAVIGVAVLAFMFFKK